MIIDIARGRRFAVHRAILSAVLYSSALTIACLVSYLLITRGLDAVRSVSRTDDYLGGMWAVVATVFVYRIGYRESIKAAVTRTWATLLSFALCLAYLLIFPFSPLGLAVLVGLGSLIVTFVGRPEDVVTAGITTAVVMVVAALAPANAWEEPILRLVDTAVGIGVGLAVSWLTCHAVRVRPRFQRPLRVRRPSGGFGQREGTATPGLEHSDSTRCASVTGTAKGESNAGAERTASLGYRRNLRHRSGDG